MKPAPGFFFFFFTKSANCYSFRCLKRTFPLITHSIAFAIHLQITSVSRDGISTAWTLDLCSSFHVHVSPGYVILGTTHWCYAVPLLLYLQICCPTLYHTLQRSHILPVIKFSLIYPSSYFHVFHKTKPGKFTHLFHYLSI